MRNNTLIIALIASLGVNLALGGFILGRLSGSDWDHQPPLAPMHGIVRWTKNLEQARRDEIRPLVADYARTLAPSARDVHRAQVRLRDALLADPLDREALRDALAKFRAALVESQASGEGAFVMLAAELSAEERASLAASLRRLPHHRRPPGRHPHAPDHDRQ